MSSMSPFHTFSGFSRRKSYSDKFKAYGRDIYFSRNSAGYGAYTFTMINFNPAPLTVFGATRSSLRKFEWTSYNYSQEFTVDFDQLHHNEEVDRFLSPSDSSDVALVVKGEKIYDKKETFALQSDYFKTLFFGDFAEKDQDEVKIGDDVSSEEMLALVMLLSKSKHYVISNGNCESMIRLADRFGVAWLAHECFLFVALHSKLPLAKRFELLMLSHDEHIVESFLDKLSPSESVSLADSYRNTEAKDQFDERSQYKMFRRAFNFMRDNTCVVKRVV